MSYHQISCFTTILCTESLRTIHLVTHIEHGIKGGLTNSFAQAKLATECGYWPTFRFDPRKEVEGKNPFIIDSTINIMIIITQS